MQKLKQLINWLKSLFIKSTEATTMTDTSADVGSEVKTEEVPAAVVDPAAGVPATPVAVDDESALSDVERFAAKLKELVETAGSQAHAYFDDLVELAKKLI